MMRDWEFQPINKLSLRQVGFGIPLISLLTHLPLNKMATNLADDIFNHIFLNENVWILIEIPLKFVPKGLIDNKPAFVQVMAWHRTGDKPLPGPMLTQFNNAYMRR